MYPNHETVSHTTTTRRDLMKIAGAFAAGFATLSVARADKPAAPAPAARRTEPAQVHIYPTVLTAEDALRDGPKGKSIKITEDSVLIWVDLMPDARYAHDTQYVLISNRGARVEKGQWWPELNGKPILRGQSAKVQSPIATQGAKRDEARS